MYRIRFGSDLNKNVLKSDQSVPIPVIKLKENFNKYDILCRNGKMIHFCTTHLEHC